MGVTLQELLKLKFFHLHNDDEFVLMARYTRDKGVHFYSYIIGIFTDKKQLENAILEYHEELNTKVSFNLSVAKRKKNKVYMGVFGKSEPDAHIMDVYNTIPDMTNF